MLKDLFLSLDIGFSLLYFKFFNPKMRRRVPSWDILFHRLKIWSLLVKGLQSCWPSNFENDLTPGGLKPGQITLAHTLAVMAKVADFFLRTSNLTASNFEANWPTVFTFWAFKDLVQVSKGVGISRGWQHYKGEFCPLKVTSFS